MKWLIPILFFIVPMTSAQTWVSSVLPEQNELAVAADANVLIRFNMATNRPNRYTHDHSFSTNLTPTSINDAGAHG